MRAGVCESPSNLAPSLPKANAPLGRFARACVNLERDTLGRVAEAALTPKKRTEQPELSIVNIRGGMWVAIKLGSITTEANAPDGRFTRGCVDPERYAHG